jgi:hypothetical protein
VGHIKHPEKAILRPWWVTFSPVWVRFMPHRFFPKIPNIYGSQNAPNPGNLAPTSSTGLPILRYDLKEIFFAKSRRPLLYLYCKIHMQGSGSAISPDLSAVDFDLLSDYNRHTRISSAQNIFSGICPAL